MPRNSQLGLRDGGKKIPGSEAGKDGLGGCGQGLQGERGRAGAGGGGDPR